MKNVKRKLDCNLGSFSAEYKSAPKSDDSRPSFSLEKKSTNVGGNGSGINQPKGYES